MIRKLLAAVAVLFIGIAAQAQHRVTQRDLLGNWHIRAVSIRGLYYDSDSDSMSVSDSLVQTATEEELSTTKNYMQKIFEEKIACTQTFTADGQLLTIGKANDKKRAGYFKLVKKNNLQYLVMARSHDAVPQEYTVRLENGLLHLTHQDDGTGQTITVLAR